MSLEPKGKVSDFSTGFKNALTAGRKGLYDCTSTEGGRTVRSVMLLDSVPRYNEDIEDIYQVTLGDLFASIVHIDSKLNKIQGSLQELENRIAGLQHTVSKLAENGPRLEAAESRMQAVENNLRSLRETLVYTE